MLRLFSDGVGCWHDHDQSTGRRSVQQFTNACRLTHKPHHALLSNPIVRTAGHCLVLHTGKLSAHCLACHTLVWPDELGAVKQVCLPPRLPTARLQLSSKVCSGLRMSAPAIAVLHAQAVAAAQRHLQAGMAAGPPPNDPAAQVVQRALGSTCCFKACSVHAPNVPEVAYLCPAIKQASKQ